jgi:hypothetical protein
MDDLAQAHVTVTLTEGFEPFAVNCIVDPLVTGAVQVIVTDGSLFPGAKVPPEGFTDAMPEVVTDHVIGVPPRFDTVTEVAVGAVQLPASTAVGLTLSAAGTGVAVGNGVAVRVGVGIRVGVAVTVAVAFGVGLALGTPGDDVGDVVEVVATAVALGCT